MPYGRVLWARDDTLWLRPFRMADFEDRYRNTLTLHSRGCKAWGGINDKLVLLQRPAATYMMTAYSSWWNLSFEEVCLEARPLQDPPCCSGFSKGVIDSREHLHVCVLLLRRCRIGLALQTTADVSAAKFGEQMPIASTFAAAFAAGNCRCHARNGVCDGNGSNGLR